nr:MAG TPA: hypothetical protein [Caudoviricetes sp.]
MSRLFFCKIFNCFLTSNYLTITKVWISYNTIKFLHI